MGCKSYCVNGSTIITRANTGPTSRKGRARKKGKGEKLLNMWYHPFQDISKILKVGQATDLRSIFVIFF